ncbi:MAG: serine/threonine protein kinase [Planctomycetales bacterium]|nr:serine/threonine protein kinase [Planctomycetales bacterium]
MNIPSCPQCGSPLDPSMAGLCATCLMERGMELPPTLAGNPQDLGVLSPGQLAPYFPDLEIQKLLGYGGMGAVYLARQKKLDRSVALKVLHPDAAKDPSFAERFEREARAMAKLSHPNIVTIHDFDHVELSVDGERRMMFYIIMELVEGTDLRAVLDQDKLEPRQALMIVQQICEALQFAHDRGVVHRDIKPENILIDSNGVPKVADFGLAKLAAHSLQNHSLTATHQVVGTPRYMAPEQLEGTKEVDHRADLYSVGVVFYEMLTGELPLGRFDLPSESAGVDARLDQVVLRTLAKEPRRRYQQASEIRDDVRSLSSSDSPLQPAAPPQRTAFAQSPRKVAGPHLGGSHHDGAPQEAMAPREIAGIYGTACLFLAIAGVVSMFLPWTRIYLTSTLAAHLFGYQYSLPVAASLLCAVVLVLSYLRTLRTVVGSRDQGEGQLVPLSHARAITAIAAGLALVVVSLLTFKALPVLNMDYGYIPDWTNAQGWRDLRTAVELAYRNGSSNVSVHPQVGPYVAMISGILLVAVSLWELATIHHASSESGGGASLQYLTVWLRRLVVLNWAMLPAMFALWAWWVKRLNHHQGPFLLYFLITLMVAHGVYTLLSQFFYLIAASRIEHRESPMLIRSAAVIAMLPVSPMVVFSWPVAIWLWLSLNHPDVDRAFRERAVEPETLAKRLRVAGSRLRLAGAVHALWWVAGTLLVSVKFVGVDVRTFAFLLGFLGMTVGLGAGCVVWLCGGDLANRGRLMQGRLASYLAMLPLSPGWLAGLPVAIDTLYYIHQAERADAGSSGDTTPRSTRRWA